MQNYVILIVIALLAIGVGIQLVLFAVFQRLAPVVEAFAHRHNLRVPSPRRVAFVVIAVAVIGICAHSIRACYLDWDDYRRLQSHVAETCDLKIQPLKEDELEAIKTSWRHLEREDATEINEALASLGRAPTIANLIAVVSDRSMPPYSWWSSAANRANRERAFTRLSIVEFKLLFACKAGSLHLSADQRSLVIYDDRRTAILLSDSIRGIDFVWCYTSGSSSEPGVGADSR